jgi:ATP-binding protein involved in chromosome partitioning
MRRGGGGVSHRRRHRGTWRVRARHEADRLGTEFLGEVPLDMAIRETSGGGHPIAVAALDSPHAKIYWTIAARLWHEVFALLGDPRCQPPRIVIQ